MNFDGNYRINELRDIVDFSEMNVYPDSFQVHKATIFFMGKEKWSKYLYIFFEDNQNEIQEKFTGVKSEAPKSGFIKKCGLTTENRLALQQIFGFTRPICLGLNNSFGFGDRLGLANPAHIRSLGSSRFKPVFAQQSIRELTRTKRTPTEVMDAAVWAVFQEGYKEGFGADADHLKTPEDIDLMVQHGFSMFTFDPGEYVRNEADIVPVSGLDPILKSINWKGLSADYKLLSDIYLNKKYEIDPDLEILADEEALKRAVVKYGDAIAHMKKMYDHLKINYPDYNSEVEISVDETESVTTPFEHFFIASELNRLNVKIISLAPRFVGSFEKGIDYKGDLGLFRREYIKHVKIAAYFGNYKISLHSGSDKFTVYRIISSINTGYTHIKTAGTSYLEALKVAAIKEPDLFREILDYCRGLYDNEKYSYHVSADINKIQPAREYSDQVLVSLFMMDDLRQILHVTFGRVLTDRDSKGEFKFKKRLMDCLSRNEEVHYEVLRSHFRKHLEPFENQQGTK
jgi:tagaturonate epimerase